MRSSNFHTLPAQGKFFFLCKNLKVNNLRVSLCVLAMAALVPLEDRGHALGRTASEDEP